MPKTIRNRFDEKLTYDSLMKAHILSRKGKGYRGEVILINLKQEAKEKSITKNKLVYHISLLTIEKQY